MDGAGALRLIPSLNVRKESNKKNSFQAFKL
jgi:hypothetical protein